MTAPSGPTTNGPTTGGAEFSYPETALASTSSESTPAPLPQESSPPTAEPAPGTGAELTSADHNVHQLRRGDWALLAGISTISFGLATALSLQQWLRYEVPSWDLGIFTQVARGWSQGELPISHIKGDGFPILGDHFHPVLALLGPIYAIFPSGFTLLVVQNLLIALTTAIIGYFAMSALGRGNGALIAGASAIAWGWQSAVASQFHEISFALPLLALACGFLIQRRPLATALAAAPLVLVKEDLGLTVAAVGVVIAIRWWHDSGPLTTGRIPRWLTPRLIGMGLVIWGGVWFWLTTSVILPAFNPDGQWDYADDSIISLLSSAPAEAVGRLFDGAGTKAITLVMTFLPVAFLALASPLALITLPTFAWRFTSEVPFHWGTDWHYTAVLVPVVFLALVDVLNQRRLRAKANPIRPYTPFITTAVMLLAVVIALSFPYRNLASPSWWESTPLSDSATEAQGLIPDGARVVTDITLMAYLAPRTDVYWMGHDNPLPDYVVFNLSSGIFGDSPPESAQIWATQQYPDSHFREVFHQDGWSVATRID